jgi:hypothetical protein
MIAARLGRAGTASARLRPKHYAGKWRRFSEKWCGITAPSHECVGLPTRSRLSARLRPARFHLVFSVRPQA